MLPLALIDRYHADQESVFEHGKLHNYYRGSSLEVVVEADAEQKQVFAGAAHLP